MSTANTSRLRDLIAGFAGLLALALVIWLCLAFYTQSFSSYETVTVESPRSGLLLDAGAPVMLRGVDVGSVGSVKASGNGAAIELRLDPASMARIPANAKVEIVPPTVFGAKYIEFLGNSAPGTRALRPGAVIDSSHVTVEINQTFDSVAGTLTALQPMKLNQLLTGAANILRGRGQQLRQLIQGSNTLASALNPQIGMIGADAQSAAVVAQSYQPTVDNLVRTLSEGSNVLSNLARQESTLQATLTSMWTLDATVTPFLDAIAPVFAQATSILLPVIGLLSRYSPEYACVLEGVARNDNLLSAIMGGPAFGGSHVNGHATFGVERGVDPYKYPQNLPIIGANSGPNCDGLPNVHGHPVPYVNYNTGANPYPHKQDTSQVGTNPISLILFGKQVGTATQKGGGK